MHTLREWGELVLARRQSTHRSAQTDACRWGAHVESAPFIDSALNDIKRAHVREWVRELPRRSCVVPAHMKHLVQAEKTLSRPTVVNLLTLLRAVLEEAVQDGHIDSNPASGIRVTMPTGRTHEPWTYLALEEQRRLLLVTPEPLCHLVAFALYTGLRMGELFALKLEDLHVDDERPHVVVRFGKPRRGQTQQQWQLVPKNGRIRTVPLTGLAVDVARRWLVALPRWAPSNPSGLVFPRPRGGRWRKPPHQWERAVRDAALGRPFRFHDLRHSCAASLVSGMWGPALRLEDVRGFLGHRDLQSTMRYAHLAQSRLDDVAASIGRADVGQNGASAQVRETASLSMEPAKETSPNLPEGRSGAFSHEENRPLRRQARATDSIPSASTSTSQSPDLASVVRGTGRQGAGNRTDAAREGAGNLESAPSIVRARSVLAAVARISVDALASEGGELGALAIIAGLAATCPEVAPLEPRPGLRKVSSLLEDDDAKAGGGTA